MPYLVVIYGAPFSGKSSIAWELARSLPGKTAVLSVDALLRGAIAVPDEDAAAELEMVHLQLRLLTSNMLKNRYNVVIEGPFYFVLGDVLHRHEQDIDQIIALMRNLARVSLVVRLGAGANVLRRRAIEAGREAEIDAALRVEAAYRNRYGGALRFDTSETEAAEVAALIREQLLHE